MVGENIPEMVTIRAAAKRTGLSYDAIRKMCLDGEITHIRVGSGRGKILVNLDRFVEYLNGEGAAV